MSIESSSPIRVGPAVAPATSAPAPAGAADRILSPIDHLHDQLAGGLAQLGQVAEAEAAERGTVLGWAAQFLVGAAGAFATMAEGMWQMVRHPIRTIEGLLALASHVPLISPTWWWRVVTLGPGQTLAEDRAFVGAVAKAFLAPYQADWKRGRYFAVAGRAAVDVGTLYVGLKQAKTAIDRWRAERAARTPEVALVNEVMGPETRASGQVLGEGTTVVGAKGPGAAVADARYGAKAAMEHPWASKPQVKGKDLLEFSRKHRGERGVLPTAAEPTREVLERAASRFPGDKKQIYAEVVKQLEKDQALFRRLRQVGPERLATDGWVQRRFRLLTRSVDGRMDAELRTLLGFEPQGVPKDPLRAAAKLESWQAVGGDKVRLGNLDDLARGRIDLGKFDPTRMRHMLKRIRQHFGDDNLIVNDYIAGKPFYRGRLHVKIRDASGLWYELQMGPKQLSTFYDTPFSAAGRSTNVHDAIYKGILKLDDQAVKLLGKGDVAIGQDRIARLLDRYVDEVNDVMDVARRGEPYVFQPQTSALRRELADLLDELPEERLPIGLR